MREHLFGPCATFDGDSDSVAVDIGGLIRRLLLFERFTLQPTRLKEVPHLVAAFGYGGIRELLSSGAIGIYCDAVTIGEIGQTTELGSRAIKGPLPLGSYSFSAIVPHCRRDYIHQCMTEVESSPGLTSRQAIKLKGLIARRLTEPLVTGAPTLAAMEQDLEANHPVVARSVALALSRNLGRHVEPSDLNMRIERIDEADFRVETSFADRVGLQPEQAHQVIGRGLLGVGGLNQRIEQMHAFDAVSGMENGELPVFESKLDFLVRQLDPDAQLSRFDRVLRIANIPLPDISPAEIDLSRVLTIRESDDCREMRQWLRSTDALTDDQLHDSFHRVREQLQRAYHGVPGRVLRLAVGTGIGALPAVGSAAGAAFGVLDSFLLDRVVREPGPYSFLSHHYGSIFRGS
jgi:hypothetical protein